jgi:hypothetical protein
MNKDGVSYILEKLAEEFPTKSDLSECYQEVADYLRGLDLPQKDVERVLRLLRKKCVVFISVSDALRKWSLING